MGIPGFGKSKIPFEMFDLSRSADEARRMTKLGSLYHRGQDLAWDGRAVLKELLAKHGGIKIKPELRAPMAKIFGVIMWGELAAWKISAELADQVVPLEARMAATSQAHDEARHFYVMHDYLTELGCVPTEMDRASRGVLDSVLETRNLAKKLLGMQLMVETTALTIFQAVRDVRVEPVLAELLRYYEKDEARHVGLGVQLLPGMLKKMSRLEAVGLFAFQMQIVGWTIAGLKSLESSLTAIGIDTKHVLELGRAKQTMAFNQVWEQMELEATPKSREAVLRLVNAVTGGLFVAGDKVGWRERVAGWRAGWNEDLYRELMATSLSPDDKIQNVRAISGG